MAAHLIFTALGQLTIIFQSLAIMTSHHLLLAVLYAVILLVPPALWDFALTLKIPKLARQELGGATRLC